jgi:hypothetical protein
MSETLAYAAQYWGGVSGLSRYFVASSRVIAVIANYGLLYIITVTV